MPRVIAVIVHWGDPEETLGCVEASIAEASEIVVVDNGSHTPMASRLAASFPGVVCVVNARNEGYAGGANTGIRTALARGADVVLVLNNDARLWPGATAGALGVLAEDARVAVVGAKVVTREDAGRLWLAWGRVTWRQSLVALEGADVPDGPAYAVRRDVDWVAGCALWIPRRALEALGHFDDAFFAYHEEVDWCARARAAGWRVVYAPEVVVSHTGRGSSGTRRSIRVRKYFGSRNTILFARKHATLGQWVFLIAFLIVALPAELVWHLVRGAPGDTLLKLRGLYDAIRRRPLPLAMLGLE